MSKVKENNCRLCLTMLDVDYNIIEEITKEMLKALQLKVDFSISEEPLLCESCMRNIQEAYDFKSTCIAAEKQIASLAIDRNCAVVDIRDVYLNENENKRLVFNEDYNICRFCMQCMEKSNFNLLDDLRRDSPDEMLLKCIPEMDLNIIKEPVVCAACLKSLQSYHTFAMKCRNTEVHIAKYCEVQGAEWNGHVSLSNVLKFVFENGLETAVIKEEDNLFQHDGNTYSDVNNIVVKIEEEKLFIKEENKYGDHKNEGNHCGETKRKEIVEYDMPTNKNSSEKYTLINKKNTKVHKCNLCSYKAKRKDMLTQHLITHKDSSDAVMYRCERCTFETKYKTYLKRHMLIHKDDSEVTMYKCNLCNHETKWKIGLTTHMLTHKDSSNVEFYRCESCTFQTKHKKNLKMHMLTHKDNSEVTMYKCNLCSYESKRKDVLRGHMLIHKASSDIIMYKCEKCTFKTKYKGSLKEHMLIHKDNSEVIMYKCNVCRYEAKWRSSLKKHMLIHKDSSEVATYRCERCTFETKYKISIKKHVLIHKDNSEDIM